MPARNPSPLAYHLADTNLARPRHVHRYAAVALMFAVSFVVAFALGYLLGHR